MGLAAAGATGAAAQTSRVAKTPPGKCDLKLVAALPVVLEDGLPYIKARINGRDARILANTVSEISAMNDAAASDYGLKVRPYDAATIYSEAGKQKPGVTTVERLSLGEAETRDQDFFVLTGVGARPSFISLGRPLFSRTDVEFDLAHNVIRLLQPVGCGPGHSLGYWGPDHGVAPLRSALEGGGFVVKVSLNGRPVDAMLSTASAYTTVGASLAKGLGINPPAEGEPGVGAFTSFTIGDETVTKPRLLIDDVGLNAQDSEAGTRFDRAVFARGPQMALGVDFLRSHRVLVSSSQRKVYFSYVGGPAFQAPGAARAD